MNKQPQFSIIIPIYRVADYLEKAIKSILNQSYDDYELILVDDGSPDECPAICDRYKEIDSRIVVIHKQNGGLVSARKAGVNIAKGHYSICLDGDDWLDENALRNISTVIIENEQPDIICFGIINHDDKKDVKTIVRNRAGYYSRDQIINNIFPMLIQKEDATYFAPSLCGKAIKTELYRDQQKQVPQEIVIWEDGACTIPCVFRAKSLFIMNEHLYYYRQNEASVTKKKKELSWDIPVINFNHLARTLDIDLYDFREQVYRKICHDTFLVVVASFYSDKSYFKIRKDINEHMRSKIIAEAVNKARFNNSIKASAMMFLLKHKVYLPFKLYSYIR